MLEEKRLGERDIEGHNCLNFFKVNYKGGFFGSRQSMQVFMDSQNA